MKKFSTKRWLTLRSKLSYTEGLFPQICGYLTPAEVWHLLEMGMRLPDNVRDGCYGSRAYVAECIQKGNCDPGWAYFTAGPHNPEFVAELSRGRWR